MTESLKVLAHGKCDSREAVTTNISNTIANYTDPYLFYFQVSSPSEQVRLQAATRYAMSEACTRSTAVVAVCGIDEPNTQANAGSKRKRDEDDVARYVYTIIAPV